MLLRRHPKTKISRSFLPVSAIITFVYSLLVWVIVFLLQKVALNQGMLSDPGEGSRAEIALPPFSGLADTLSGLNAALAAFVAIEVGERCLDSQRRFRFWILAIGLLGLIGLLQLTAQKIGAGTSL